MRGLGQRLRERARELELTDAEVARRAGLTARRYGHYVTDRNEPDLATLVSLCVILETTPNCLLGYGESHTSGNERQLQAIDAITAQLRRLDEPMLGLARGLIDVLVRQSGGRD